MFHTTGKKFRFLISQISEKFVTDFWRMIDFKPKISKRMLITLLFSVGLGQVKSDQLNFTVGQLNQTLPCKLAGTFTLPQWYGPPSASFIIANQDDSTLNPAFAPVQEGRLVYSSNNIDLVLKTVNFSDAGEYQCSYTLTGSYTFTVVVQTDSGGCSCCPCENCTCECNVAWEILTAIGVALSLVGFAVCVVIIFVVSHKCGFKTRLIVAISVTAITFGYDMVVGIVGIVDCKNGCDCNCNCTCPTCEDFDRVEVVIGLGGTCIALAVAELCVCVGLIIKLKQAKEIKLPCMRDGDKDERGRPDGGARTPTAPEKHSETLLMHNRTTHRDDQPRARPQPAPPSSNDRPMPAIPADKANRGLSANFEDPHRMPGVDITLPHAGKYKNTLDPLGERVSDADVQERKKKKKKKKDRETSRSEEFDS